MTQTRWKLLQFVLLAALSSCGKEREGASPAPEGARVETTARPERARAGESVDERVTDESGTFWPKSVGELPTRQAAPGPHYRRYYNDVFVEMLDSTKSSQRLLSESLSMRSPPAVPDATKWTSLFHEFMPFDLAKRFWPPRQLIPVPIQNEGGCCDLIRGRFRVAPYVVEKIEARHIVAVRVTGFERTRARPIEDVTRFAAEFFQPGAVDLAGTRIEFSWLQINDADGTDPDDPAYGCHDVRKKRHSPHDHWADKMNWWIRPGEIGFISSKGQGTVTQHFPNLSSDYNRTWFDEPH